MVFAWLVAMPGQASSTTRCIVKFRVVQCRNLGSNVCFPSENRKNGIIT